MKIKIIVSKGESMIETEAKANEQLRPLLLTEWEFQEVKISEGIHSVVIRITLCERLRHDYK